MTVGRWVLRGLKWGVPAGAFPHRSGGQSGPLLTTHAYVDTQDRPRPLGVRRVPRAPRWVRSHRPPGGAGALERVRRTGARGHRGGRSHTPCTRRPPHPVTSGFSARSRRRPSGARRPACALRGRRCLTGWDRRGGRGARGPNTGGDAGASRQGGGNGRFLALPGDRPGARGATGIAEQRRDARGEVRQDRTWGRNRPCPPCGESFGQHRRGTRVSRLPPRTVSAPVLSAAMPGRTPRLSRTRRGGL